MSSAEGKGTSTEAGKSSQKRRTRTRSKTVIDKAALVNKLLRSINQRLDKDDFKATLGDLIRLLQLQKELEQEEPREVEVRWVEPEPADANEK